MRHDLQDMSTTVPILRPSRTSKFGDCSCKWAGSRLHTLRIPRVSNGFFRADSFFRPFGNRKHVHVVLLWFQLRLPSWPSHPAERLGLGRPGGPECRRRVPRTARTRPSRCHCPA